MSDEFDEAADILRGVTRVAVLTGAGVSADSGVPTFRASDGLWEGHRIEDVATPSGFARDPELVWEFYNQRRVNVAGGGVAPSVGAAASATGADVASAVVAPVTGAAAGVAAASLAGGAAGWEQADNEANKITGTSKWRNMGLSPVTNAKAEDTMPSAC